MTEQEIYKELMKDKTQKEAEAITGIAQAQLSDWNTGKVTPRLSSLHKLAAKLGKRIVIKIESK